MQQELHIFVAEHDESHDIPSSFLVLIDVETEFPATTESEKNAARSQTARNSSTALIATFSSKTRFIERQNSKDAWG
jgi:hypothetical protein